VLRGELIADDPTTEVSSLNCEDVMQSKEVQLEPGKLINLPAAGVLSLAIEVAKCMLLSIKRVRGGRGHPLPVVAMGQFPYLPACGFPRTGRSPG
jgi:hypothetical protein